MNVDKFARLPTINAGTTDMNGVKTEIIGPKGTIKLIMKHKRPSLR